jgi:carboxyl-terminal processing protease
VKNSPLFRLRFLALFLAAWVAGLASTDRNYSTTPLMSNETRTLVQMLEFFHYNKDAVSSTDYNQLVTEYMGDLDPQRLFFTAQDEQALRQQYGPRLMTDLSILGNIDAAFAIFRVYEQRVQTRSTWIFDQLGQDFDFAAKENYAPDRSKSPWPATTAEADDLWRKRLKYEMLPQLLDGKTVDEAKATVRKRHERLLKNLGDIDANDIQEAYLTSLTKMYDPHSSYFSADTLEDFSIQMRLSLVGIGAVLGLDDDGYCVVREIVPGGPADLSGLIKVNDKITFVQQPGAEPVEIIGMKLRRIVEMIRGPKGSQVVLSVQPHTPDAKAREVTITRDVIKLNSARAIASIHEVPDSAGLITPVGVIALNSFYGPSAPDDPNSPAPEASATKDVAELIAKLKQAGAKALVIDLRRNGGGLLSEAVNMTGLFIGKGPVVQVRDSLGRLVVDNNTETPIAYDGPLAVLTSRFSASASEIFAGALQNYGRAVIVGDSSTHGKGTVQAVLEMKNYLPRLAQSAANRTGAAKLTIQKFYLPNGSSTQKKGVTPDISLPSIDDYLPYVGESNLPHALVWDEINNANAFDGKPLAKAFVQPLAQASRDRQQSLEEFTYLIENVTRFRRQIEQKIVSLNLDERRAQKETDAEFKKRMDVEVTKLAKANFTRRDIKLDAVVVAEAAGQKPATPAAEDGDTDALDADTAAKLDIHLRETLRVVVDAANLTRDTQFWANGTVAPIVSKGDRG